MEGYVRLGSLDREAIGNQLGVCLGVGVGRKDGGGARVSECLYLCCALSVVKVQLEDHGKISSQIQSSISMKQAHVSLQNKEPYTYRHTLFATSLMVTPLKSTH